MIQLVAYLAVDDADAPRFETRGRLLLSPYTSLFCVSELSLVRFRIPVLSRELVIYRGTEAKENMIDHLLIYAKVRVDHPPWKSIPSILAAIRTKLCPLPLIVVTPERVVAMPCKLHYALFLFLASQRIS